MEQEDEIQLMHGLVEKYSSFEHLEFPFTDIKSTPSEEAFPEELASSQASEVIVRYSLTSFLPLQQFT